MGSPSALDTSDLNDDTRRSGSDAIEDRPPSIGECFAITGFRRAEPNMRQTGAQTRASEADVVRDHRPASRSGEGCNLIIRRRLSKDSSDFHDVFAMIEEHDRNGSRNIVVDQPHVPLPGSTRVRASRLDVRWSQVREFGQDPLFVPAIVQEADDCLRSDSCAREDSLVAEDTATSLDPAGAVPLAELGDIPFKRALDLANRHRELEDDLTRRSRGFVVAFRTDIDDIVIRQKRKSNLSERRIEVEGCLQSA